MIFQLTHTPSSTTFHRNIFKPAFAVFAVSLPLLLNIKLFLPQSRIQEGGLLNKYVIPSKIAYSIHKKKLFGSVWYREPPPHPLSAPLLSSITFPTYSSDLSRRRTLNKVYSCSKVVTSLGANFPRNRLSYLRQCCYIHVPFPPAPQPPEPIPYHLLSCLELLSFITR